MTMSLDRMRRASAHIPHSDFIPAFDVLRIECPSAEAVELVASMLEQLAAELREAPPDTAGEAYARYLESSEWRVRLGRG